MHADGREDRAAAGARLAQGGYVPAFVCEYLEMASAHGGLRRRNARKGVRKRIGAGSDTKRETTSVAYGASCGGSPRVAAARAGDAMPDATLAAQGTDDDRAAVAGDRIHVLVWDPIALQELRALLLMYAKQLMSWAPRALRVRLCAIWCGLIQGALQSQDAECANVLLFTVRSRCYESL